MIEWSRGVYLKQPVFIVVLDDVVGSCQGGNGKRHDITIHVCVSCVVMDGYARKVFQLEPPIVRCRFIVHGN